MAILIGTAPGASALEFTIEDDGQRRWIEARGSIEKGDERRFFDAFHAIEDDVEWIVLRSDGGYIMESIELGRTIRSLGFSTAVAAGDDCLSACFFAFAGGVQRDVATGARLGLHQFYEDGTDQTAEDAIASTQATVAEMVRFIAEMGVDHRALAAALETASETMHIYSRAELRDYRLQHRPARVADTECPFPDKKKVKDPLGLYPACR